MWDNFKRVVFSDYFMPFMFYVISILDLISGKSVEAAVFLVGGCIAYHLIQVKHLLEKQTNNNTINNDGENN